MKDPLIPVDEAIARIVGALSPVGREDVAISDAGGRVLAEGFSARRTQPPVAMSAMDGYAVRAEDVASVPARLRRIGEAPAGSPFGGTVGPGEAVRIFTGGPVPEGADCIVLQEDSAEQDGIVEVREGQAKGKFVRPAGLDFQMGELGLGGGRRLSPSDIALAAAMNHPWLSVYRKPRVAILATGDEIVRPGDPIGAGQIVSSNVLALLAFVREAGGEPVDLGIAPDTIEGLQEKARGALGADLLVTTGGASVGEHDLIAEALGSIGLELDFWRIAMRPGKPLMFGRLGTVPMLGLPGNPVSTLVCAEIFLRPALERLAGLPERRRRTVPARLAEPLPQNDRRQDYLRARWTEAPGWVETDGLPWIKAFERQDSGMILPLARADGLIVRAPHAKPAEVGETVDVLLLER